MTQADLNRAVARATGETVEMVAQRGFSLLGQDSKQREPTVIDWDDLQTKRAVAIVEQRPKSRVA